MHGLSVEKHSFVPLENRVVIELSKFQHFGASIEQFQELCLEAREVRITSVGSESPLWRQIAANVFGVHTACLKTSDNTALGAAIQAS